MTIEGDGDPTDTERLAGAGGEELFVRHWQAEGSPKAVVLLVHGLGEHSGRYEHVATHLAAHGYAVSALDHRGHGRSTGARAHVDSYDDFLHDLGVVRAHAADGHPGLPLFLVGHSMGGNIALGYALEDQRHLAGLVLSGPAVVLADDVPAVLVSVSTVVARVAPKARVLALDAGKVSRDPAVVEAYRNDPLVHHGKMTAGLGAALVGSMRSFPDRVGSLTVPMLVMHGTADELAPVEGAQMLEERAGSADLTVTYYEGLAHEIFNEPEQDEVLAELTAWLDARC